MKPAGLPGYTPVMTPFYGEAEQMCGYNDCQSHIGKKYKMKHKLLILEHGESFNNKNRNSNVWRF